MAEKILIVDDDIESLKLIGHMLQRQGYEVAAANSGSQALVKAAAEHPNLIILDVMMPDMNGYDVCRRLRANPETKAIPIIMFTAKTLIDDKVAGFEAGADDYLTKPTHPAELASRIKSILSRHTTPEVKASSSGKAIGIIGAKGGLGTTTLAVNIAASLAADGKKPILADFQLGSGSMGLQLGFDSNNGMALSLTKPLDEINTALLSKEIVTHSSGIKALLSSTRPRETQINYPVENGLGVIQGLKTLGDPVICDLGNKYTTVTSRLLTAMDQIILLVEPVSITLAMAQKLLKEIKADTKKHVDVVVVTRTQAKIQVPWQEVEHILGQEILASVASAPDLATEAAAQGTPIVTLRSNAIISSQISKLAAEIYTK